MQVLQELITGTIPSHRLFATLNLELVVSADHFRFIKTVFNIVDAKIFIDLPHV